MNLINVKIQESDILKLPYNPFRGVQEGKMCSESRCSVSVSAILFIFFFLVKNHFGSSLLSFFWETAIFSNLQLAVRLANIRSSGTLTVHVLVKCFLAVCDSYRSAWQAAQAYILRSRHFQIVSLTIASKTNTSSKPDIHKNRLMPDV